MTQGRIWQRSNQFSTPALILAFVTLTALKRSLPVACAGSVKYPQMQLSSLGRQQEFGAGSPGGSKETNIADGDTGGTSKSIAGATKHGGAGEVLVPKSFPLSAQEPTCEELRAMWIFSKRQSRAAEMTNEIPTYRDPFQYNVWNPYYPTTRNTGGLRMVPRYVERTHSPVFGRIISREPVLTRLPLRPRHITDISHSSASSAPISGVGIYGSEAKASQVGASPRHQMQYRFGGGRSSHPIGGANSNSVAVQGSFQKLKELIWTERVKELTQQRRAEELAARAAVLKEIANGRSIDPNNYNHPTNSDTPLMEKNRGPEQESYQQSSDQRHSILSAQSMHQSPQSSRRGNGSGHSRRDDRMYKGSIFSGNSASTSGRSARLLLPSMVASTNRRADGSHERDIGGGTLKSFPMRSSHFRERNRSLLRDLPIAHAEQFQRSQRNEGMSLRSALGEEGLMLGQLVNDPFFPLSRATASDERNEEPIQLLDPRLTAGLHDSSWALNNDNDEYNIPYIGMRLSTREPEKNLDGLEELEEDKY